MMNQNRNKTCLLNWPIYLPSSTNSPIVVDVNRHMFMRPDGSFAPLMGSPMSQPVEQLVVPTSDVAKRYLSLLGEPVHLHDSLGNPVVVDANHRRMSMGLGGSILPLMGPPASMGISQPVKPEVSMSDLFLTAVNQVAKCYLKYIEPTEMLKSKRLFNDWKTQQDKLDVNNMYRSAGWRAIYTQNLFLSRMQTVAHALNLLLIVKEPSVIIHKASRYISLGCGPGPCISAMIMVLRQHLHLTHKITFVGLDQYSGWQPYIESLDTVDKFSKVTFQKMTISEESVNKLPKGDVVIMSYTDASVHSSGFWEKLRQRYTLILILDQRKHDFHYLLCQQQFHYVDYNCKGFKRFYYHVRR